FTITPVFNFPNPKAPLPPGALRGMPASGQELAAFDIVVLANAAAAQFSPAQQAALSQWVRDGGVLLFLTPDDDSTQGFAGSELEPMLPGVVLPPTGAKSGSILPLGLRGSLGVGGSGVPQLTAYAWEDTPRVREI